jgi:hypothetical protein
MSREQSKKSTTKSTRKPKRRTKKSVGLGDSVEKITKATGIKAVVDKVSTALGVDCGCESRKEWLNERFRYKNIQCLTDDQAARVDTSWFEGSKLDGDSQTAIARLHAEVFNHKYHKPCTCSPREWMRWINEIKEMYESYKADNK